MSNDSAYYNKKIRIRNIIIGILVFALGLVVYLWQKSSLVEINFAEPVLFDDAVKRLNNYRDDPKLKEMGKGVWYTETDMDYYLKVIYPQIKAAQEKHQESKPVPERNKYEWSPVLYYSVKEKDGINKIDFFVIPTLVHKENKSVLDFFENQQYYIKEADLTYKIKKETKRGPTSVIFNTGHLFP